jgi:hypothetical protein
MSERPFIDPDGVVNEPAQAAIDELKRSILSRHPEATFEVGPGTDDPTLIHLYAYVDLDDPEEAADEILDRMVDIQLDDGIPLHVIPMSTPARALKRAQEYAKRRKAGWRRHIV